MRNRFLTGLAVSLPLVVTVWLLWLVYRSILVVGTPVMEFLNRQMNLVLGRSVEAGNLIDPPEFVMNLIGVLLPILVVIGLGMMATNVIGKRVLLWIDLLLLKFPFVSFIYSGLKQAIAAFKGIGATKDFKRVVYVEYPAPGCRLIGFLTSQFYDPQFEKPVATVFIPTAPNPMTGFVVVIDDDKVMDSTLSLEDATKMILSAGLVSRDACGMDRADVSDRIGGKSPARQAPDKREEEEFAKWVD